MAKHLQIGAGRLSSSDSRSGKGEIDSGPLPLISGSSELPMACIASSRPSGTKNDPHPELVEGRTALIPRPWVEYMPAGLVPQFAEPSLEKSALRFLPREAQGPFVGNSRFRRSSETPAQIGPRRVDQV